MLWPSKALLGLIKLYQHTLSPDHGKLRLPFNAGSCKFYPSCSSYMQQCIVVHGVWKGLARGTLRIVRCNPFSHGGYDPV